jgi:glycosyltransferase involved in cell wall biosynthesis
LKSKYESIERADIVSIVWFRIFPPRFGGQKGIALFTKYLSDCFRINCLCSDDNPLQDEKFAVYPLLPRGKKQFLLASSYRKIVRFIKSSHCKYILMEHCYYGMAGVILKRSLNKLLIVHSHNIEYLRFKEQGSWWWPILYQIEKHTYRKADLVLFKTEQDQSFAIKKFGLKTKTTIVPYGIERTTLHKQKSREYLENRYAIEPNQKIILFASTLDYLPNAKAVEFVYNKLAPALNDLPCRILICGRNKIKGFEYLSRLKASNVIYCGEVNNIEDYFNGADVFIDPVMIAAGVQTKIIDALSYDLNVVCFEHLLNGIDVKQTGEKVFTVRQNDAIHFVEQIKLACIVTSTIPEEFYENYEWRNIAKQTATTIRSLKPFNE